MRICKYVHLSRQRGWKGVAILVGLWNTFMTFYLLPYCSQIAKTGKRKNKNKKKTSSLFLTLESDSRSWWHGAFVLGQQNYK